MPTTPLDFEPELDDLENWLYGFYARLSASRSNDMSGPASIALSDILKCYEIYGSVFDLSVTIDLIVDLDHRFLTMLKNKKPSEPQKMTKVK